MRNRFTPGLAVAVVGALGLWSCGGGGSASSSSPTAPSSSASTVAVNIMSSSGNTAFVPNPVRANAGDTVIFRNNDRAVHRIVLDDGSADLGEVAPGATSRSFVLRSADAARFHCTLHTSMVGSINGATAPEPAECPDPYGYGC